jgi:hypothetical protein
VAHKKLGADLVTRPGAAAVYNASTQSFMDEYGNWLYLTPMVIGGAITMLAAAWKFLGLGNRPQKVRWIRSMHWHVESGTSVQKQNCRISKRKSTIF